MQVPHLAVRPGINTLIDKARRKTTYNKALDGWARNVLQATTTDSVKMAEAWGKLHRTKILKHALETVRPPNFDPYLGLLRAADLTRSRRHEIAKELDITANVVFVNAHRVLKQVTITFAKNSTRIHAMPSTLLTCPDDTELLALAMGEPLDPRSAHVANCASCQSRLDGLKVEVAMLRATPAGCIPLTLAHDRADVASDRSTRRDGHLEIARWGGRSWLGIRDRPRRRRAFRVQ